MMLSNVGGEKTITEVNVKSYNHPHSHFLLIMQRKFNLNINLVHIDHFFMNVNTNQCWVIIIALQNL